MKIRPIVAWYDLWIGAYWDTKNRRLYVLPVPCLGVVIDLSHERPPVPDCCTNCVTWKTGASLATCKTHPAPRGWCANYDRGRTNV